MLRFAASEVCKAQEVGTLRLGSTRGTRVRGGAELGLERLQAQYLLKLFQRLFARIQLAVDVPCWETRNVGCFAHIDLVVLAAI